MDNVGCTFDLRFRSLSIGSLACHGQRSSRSAEQGVLPEWQSEQFVAVRMRIPSSGARPGLHTSFEGRRSSATYCSASTAGRSSRSESTSCAADRWCLLLSHQSSVRCRLRPGRGSVRLLNTTASRGGVLAGWIVALGVDEGVSGTSVEIGAGMSMPHCRLSANWVRPSSSTSARVIVSQQILL